MDRKRRLSESSGSRKKAKHESNTSSSSSSSSGSSSSDSSDSDSSSDSKTSSDDQLSQQLDQQSEQTNVDQFEKFFAVIPIDSVASDPQQLPGIDSFDIDFLSTDRENKTFRILRTLSTGSYGSVVAVKQSPDETDFAIKILKRGVLHSNRKTIRREVTITQQLMESPHKNILLFETVLLAPNRVYIVSELSLNGNLCQLMQKQDSTGQLIWSQINETRVKYLIHCIASGVQHLHRLDISHGDIKPENILIFQSSGRQSMINSTGFTHLLPKLCDFSNSRQRSVTDPAGQILYTQRTCSLSYSAPESGITISSFPYDMIKADVYSVGCNLLAIMLGMQPFLPQNKDIATGESLDNICNSYKINFLFVRRMVYGLTVSEQLKDLIWTSMDVSPVYRITLDQFLTHNWFINE